MSEGAKEQVAEAFRQTPDLTSRWFADLSGETPEGAEPAKAERPEDQLLSQYVHLGDVQTISSTGERANLSGALWRGRLAAAHRLAAFTDLIRNVRWRCF